MSGIPEIDRSLHDLFDESYAALLRERDFDPVAGTVHNHQVYVGAEVKRLSLVASCDAFRLGAVDHELKRGVWD